MNKVWAVIRREFLERVRTKWFLISTILGPLFMVCIAVLPSLLAMKSGKVSRIVIVSGGADSLAQRVRAQLSRSSRFDTAMTIVSVDEDRVTVVEDSLLAEVRGEKMDGYLTLTSGTIEGGKADYRARNVSSLRDMSMLESAVRQSVMIERLQRRGIDPAVVQEAQGRIDVRTQRISSRTAGGESGEATFFLGYGVGLVLYMVILLYGINVMRSVLEEKQTRIIEVLVSSLRPFQLMMGKVIGVGAVGLFQFILWTGIGYVLAKFRNKLLAMFGVAPDAASSFQLPSISGELLAICGIYFLLGYLLYSSLFAVVGASCNTETEAQQAQQPVMMLLVASLIVSFSALSDPTGRLAVGASLFPLSAPIVMPVRVATSDVAPSQIFTSIGIMILTSIVVVWVAARVYRIGILMYGKRPSMKELLHWARQS
jgi:ABC-2 type transport system permease protein